ncbi:MAG: sensor histidine kinase [Alphaproteobacteria bacterium]|nr:sensor histidine kinase [Alphaproteobacteria bacterium]
MNAILAQSQHTPQKPMFVTPDLIAEANHRIANSLTLLVSMVRMQAVSVKKGSATLTQAEVRQLLDGVAARINTISQLHRLLSRTGSEGAVSLKPHLSEVTDALVAALSSPEQSVRVVHSGGDCIVLMRQVQPIVLILCEVFINAMKHAHPAGVPLVMTVDCSPSQNGRLVLSISDDGVGLPDGFDHSGGGMGFKVMRSLATEIGADLQIIPTPLGLTFRLSLAAGTMAGGKLA